MAFRNELAALRAQNESLEQALHIAEEKNADAEQALARTSDLETELREAAEKIADLESRLAGPAGKQTRRAALRRRALGVAAVALLVAGGVALSTMRKERDTARAELEQEKAALRRAESERESSKRREETLELRLATQADELLRAREASADTAHRSDPVQVRVNSTIRVNGEEVLPGAGAEEEGVVVEDGSVRIETRSGTFQITAGPE
ncbi:MAG: hypothetical protein AAGE52_02445 [Myxococcota bacterium]